MPTELKSRIQPCLARATSATNRPLCIPYLSYERVRWARGRQDSHHCGQAYFVVQSVDIIKKIERNRWGRTVDIVATVKLSERVHSTDGSWSMHFRCDSSKREQVSIMLTYGVRCVGLASRHASLKYVRNSKKISPEQVRHASTHGALACLEAHITCKWVNSYHPTSKYSAQLVYHSPALAFEMPFPFQLSLFSLHNLATTARFPVLLLLLSVAWGVTRHPKPLK